MSSIEVYQTKKLFTSRSLADLGFGISLTAFTLASLGFTPFPVSVNNQSLSVQMHTY